MTSHCGIGSSNITCVDVAGYFIAIGPYNAGISYSKDAGANWTQLITGLASSNIVDIAIDGDIIYIACFSGIEVYDTSGTPHFDSTAESKAVSANAIALSTDSIFAATDSGLQVASKSALSTWTTYDSSDLRAGSVSEVSSICINGTAVYLGSVESVIITDTSLSTFTYRPALMPYSMSGTSIPALWGGSPNIVIADNQRVSVSADNGVTWTSPAVAVGGAITSIDSDGGRLFASKYGGPLVISEDNGATWFRSADFPGDYGATSFGPDANEVKVVDHTIYLAHLRGLFVGTLSGF